MQIWNKEKSPQPSLKNRFWERLGLHLEGGWDALGPVLGALGRFLVVFLAFKINLFSSMGPRWAPASHLDRFWVVLEWFGEGSGRVLGGFGPIFGGILERFGEESGRQRQNLKRAATESLSRTPALIREASQCAGVPLRVLDHN